MSVHKLFAKLSWAELSYFVTDNLSVIQSILAMSHSVTLDQILAEVKKITFLVSFCFFPDGRTGLFSLPDPLPEYSSLDALESSLLDPLVNSSSLDPLWSRVFTESWVLSYFATVSSPWHWAPLGLMTRF
jgi:hypothetical protein